jgi:hypothetical protein
MLLPDGSRKLVVNEPTLCSPTDRQISMTERSPRQRILSTTAGLLSTHRHETNAHLDQRTLIVTIAVYLIVAAVVVCGCLFFIMRARSRD